MTTWWLRKAFNKMNYVTQEHFDAQMAIIDHRFTIIEERLTTVEGKIDQIMTVLDKIMVIVTRLDQERISAINRFERIENDVARIKQHLKLA